MPYTVELSSPSNTRRVGIKFVVTAHLKLNGKIVLPEDRHLWERRVVMHMPDGRSLTEGAPPPYKLVKVGDKGGPDVQLVGVPLDPGLIDVTWELRQTPTSPWIKAFKRDGTTTWTVPDKR